MTPEQETQRFVTTGEHDVLRSPWPGGDLLKKARTGENALRAALITEVRRRTADRVLPALPPGFDACQFVLGKVRPMVRGLFTASERQGMLHLFAKSLVFVTHASIVCRELGAGLR